jgi:PAT family beta-lactamase induction signal transducer AmpG
MLLAQVSIGAGLVLMALAEPAANAVHFAWLAVFTALAASTQDISVDAYRIEAVENEHQGAMAATYQIGYQLALIVAGAGALASAARVGWSGAYLLMAACVAVGIVTTLLIAEPERRVDAPTTKRESRVTAFVQRASHWPALLRDPVAWLIGAVVCPFIDFFARYGARTGALTLMLIVAYRLNYVTMGVAANTFYLDLGFTLDQIALVSKIYGVLMTLTGALLAGFLIKRFGIPKTLLVGWALLTVANLLYAQMAQVSPGMQWFATAVSVDNVANGIAGTAFIAYMSSLTNPAYTATQYALFGTLWSLPAKTIASQWGAIVDAWGYAPFFVYSAAIGIPAFFLILWLIRRSKSATEAAI